MNRSRLAMSDRLPISAAVTSLRTRGALVTVCHPVASLESGGLERQLAQAAALLPRDRFRHVIVTRDAGNPGESPVPLPDGVRLVRLAGSGPDPHWASALAEVIRAHGSQVLHIRGFSMLLDAVFAAESAGPVTLAFSFHGFEEYPPRWSAFRRAMLRAAARNCAARWAVSRAAADSAAAELRMDPAEFSVLPNGVDTAHFVPAEDRQSIRAPLGLPPDLPILLTVGNLKPVKGHDVLLKALAIARARGGEFRAVFVGRDYLDGALQRLAHELRLDDFVSFVGAHDDTRIWHQAADIFVLPSRWEGMSNALLEAMACGVACVATDVGGNREAIDDGVTGRLVRPGCADSLACALAELLSESHVRKQLGAAARAFVCAHHSIENTFRLLADRYLCLAGQRTSGEPL
ncbi:MAG: hypothetical protein DCC65_05320 [Planctomycetota bacterium]|nr:MAG: hypothetical protein DCC65_05320 [Planctomycetota bacterium]